MGRIQQNWICRCFCELWWPQMVLLVGWSINWSEMVCSAGWSATHYLAQDSLEPQTVFLPPLPKHCDCRHKLLYWTKKVFEMDLCTLLGFESCPKDDQRNLVDWSPEKKVPWGRKKLCCLHLMIVFLVSQLLQMTKLRHTVRNQVVFQKPSSLDHKWLSCLQFQRH